MSQLDGHGVDTVAVLAAVSTCLGLRVTVLQSLSAWLLLIEGQDPAIDVIIPRREEGAGPERVQKTLYKAGIGQG